MKTRFVIGSHEIGLQTFYFILDQTTKEKLHYSTLTPYGNVKPLKIFQKELVEYCELLNRQNDAGEFEVDTVNLSKKEADYIVERLDSRLSLCKNMLQQFYEESKSDCNGVSLQDEVDTINSIVAKLACVRFPAFLLTGKEQK
jgi:hypothetical protein